ncbi:putative reverse transcriptase domain-containing protein, partial [Tanacetum coccineum]
MVVREDYKMGNLARVYTNEIVTRYGVHVSIISDRGGRFTFTALVDIAKGIENTAKTCVQLIILKRTDKDVHLPLAGFSYNNSYHSSIRCAPFEALYERECRSPILWAKIREKFEVGDQVSLKVSPWKGAVRFGKKCKLAPRYVRPFEILERIGLVAYRLRLKQELSNIHDTFHVSNLKKCLADANLHVPLEEIRVDRTLHFVEEPKEIMDREVKKLKR